LKPLISIIIPIYNASHLLERCIESVLANKGVFDMEIIAIDDGSNDNSVAILREKYPMVILIQQINQGPAAARNRGIKAATGKYLAFLDADDYLLPGFLVKTFFFLENNTEAIAVSVGQQHHLPSGKICITPSFLSKEKIFKEMVLEDFFTFWADHNHVCTGSVLMRTDVVKMSGGQRTELRIAEDLEFWAYLATFGVWGFIPSVLFISDGNEITKEIGWWDKNIVRWQSAPDIDKWEERIIKKAPNLKNNLGYMKSAGRVCKNLAYSALVSKRIELARNMILRRKNYFPLDLLSKLLIYTSKSRLLFGILANVLIFREKHRSI
jgi:glycosyltransferase involved in cell wall biosynthesis